MDLRKLKGFYWSAQLGSVSGAAQMTHVSQSAISHQLKSLEAELGVKLYHRAGRGITLSSEGQRLLVYARQVVHAVEDLQGEFAEVGGQPRGTIRIAAFRGMATFSLPEITRHFLARHPQVGLSIASRAFDSDILKLVTQGQADLGITASWNDFQGVDYRPFLSFKMFVCTAEDHPWGLRQEPLTLKELATQPLILYEEGTAIRDRLDQVFSLNNLQPTVPIAVGGSQALLEFVKIGLGVGIVSGLVIDTARTLGLHAIDVTDLFGQLGYGFVLPRGRYVTAATRAFLESAGAAGQCG